MFKSLLAIIAAATGAAVVVGFVPPPVPAGAAVQSTARGVSDLSAAAARTTNPSNAGCTQAWPYYEQSCLHDNRLQNGRAPIVRVIAIGKPAAADRTAQARR